MSEPSTEGQGFDLSAARDRVLDAALVHVPFDGWSERALAQGAIDAGYDASMAVRVFPRGGIEAVEHFSRRADKRMMEELGQRDLRAVKIRERVALAVRTRLEANAAHREAIRRAIALLALPSNAPLAAKLLYRTVDAIWYACGDTATDYNFYTKRALLAAVYAATVPYWLEDGSEGSADTYAFLDRRIAEVMKVPGLIKDVQDRLGRLPNPFRVLGLRPFGGR